MSEFKLISPMLDNFAMGDSINEHDGVYCCPAMENNSEDKYIVKIISTPASQTKLDALLLSGACADNDSALEYFRSITDGIIEEAQVLEKLSQLEGFLPIEKWQAELMSDGIGYNLYLLSRYRRTLQKQLKKAPMTHLGALNLGLDLCAALAVCRRLGYLYVNLKPSNIYLTAENEYRIGDLGFIKLESLKYASLPERYHSVYTAPEVTDAYSTLNTTMDVYALGLILYQIFNDGALPSVPEDTENPQLPPPTYADYEMSEIILKACARNPDDRWQDPIQMGQALVSYMQRNGAHDTPIIPQVVAAETEDQEEDTGAFEEANSDDVDRVEESDDILVDNEIEVSESDIYTEDADGNLTFIAEGDEDETLPDETNIVDDYEEITEEVNEILTQADDLIAHETPDPVVQPEPIEVTILEVIEEVVEQTAEEDSEQEETLDEDSDQTSSGSEDAPVEETEESAPDSDEPPTDDDPEEDTEAPMDEDSEPPVKKKGGVGVWIRNILLILLALAVIAAGIFFYKYYYLQPIESIILEDGELGTLTVVVNSEIDESKLTVLCLDMYGNPLTAPVKDGRAVFTGLAPDSAYTIKVNIAGFHRLTGDVSTSYTTPEETNIVQFQAVTGSEDGSVILAFTVEGPDSDLWNVYYSSQNEEEIGQSFSGHMITLTGLTVGSEYTFTLVPETELHVTGTNQVVFTASRIVKANNLVITGCVDGKLTAKWSAPEGITVENWTVRCYNDKGYDQTVVVTEPSVTFEGVDVAADHTVEVTAAGMSVSERAFAPANSVTITQATLDTSNVNQLVLDWDSSAENSWRLIYTVDGSNSQEINCETETKATVRNIVPGSEYKFSIQTTDGSHVLGGDYTYTTPEAESFSGYGVTANNIRFDMCRTPTKTNWTYKDAKSRLTTEFKVGNKASFSAKMQHEYNVSSDKVVTLYVIRDADGTVVDASSSTAKWSSMWKKNYGEFDLPTLPDAPGKYTVSIYFDGALVHTQDFTMTT